MNLEAMLKNAKSLGLQGIGIAHVGGSNPYLASCLDQSGEVCDPKNWDCQPTPEAALKNLEQMLENLVEHKARRQPAVA